MTRNRIPLISPVFALLAIFISIAPGCGGEPGGTPPRPPNPKRR